MAGSENRLSDTMRQQQAVRRGVLLGIGFALLAEMVPVYSAEVTHVVALVGSLAIAVITTVLGFRPRGSGPER